MLDMALGDLRQVKLNRGWNVDLIWRLNGLKYIAFQRDMPTKRLFDVTGTKDWETMFDYAVAHSIDIDIQDGLI